MTGEHSPAEAARPRTDPHDPPDDLDTEHRDPGERGRPAAGGTGSASPERGPDEPASGTDGAPGDPGRPQPTGDP